MTRTGLVIFCAFVLYCSPTHAAPDPQIAKQLFTRAAQVSGLKDQAYSAHLFFTFYGVQSGTAVGSVELVADGGGRARREINGDGYRDLEIVAGDKLYDVRPWRTDPDRIGQLKRVVLAVQEPGKWRQGWKLDSISHQKR